MASLLAHGLKKGGGGSSVGGSSTGGGSEATSHTSASMTADVSEIASISNGLCRFNPTSPKGKWIFLLQTVVLSFTPILILVVQNGFMFSDMIIKKDMVVYKDRLVGELRDLASLILDLQRERAAIALNTYVTIKTGKRQDLTAVFDQTDATLNKIVWKQFGTEKIFTSKLRFQIKLDDYREMATKRRTNSSTAAQDSQIMDFYILCTSKILNSLEKDAGDAQSSNNWRLIMTYFNMIKIIESTGIGLVYGLQFYGVGQLNIKQMVTYVQHNALVWEYYRQAKELVPKDIEYILDALYDGEGFKIVEMSTEQILANVLIDSDYQKGVQYFEGCSKFTTSLSRVLDLLTDRIRELGAEDLYDSMIAQVWGCFLMVLVVLISPVLIVLAKNAINTIQVFAKSVEQKSIGMKRQQKKQEKLIYRMLPKVVVDKMKTGTKVAETFESATLYFSTVVEFSKVTKKCSALEVVSFLNNLYSVMDERMDQFDVYKVETISDSYLVASGLPKKNGDRHAKEICSMALNLQAASGLIVRPDRKPNTIEIRAGVHTGGIVAGIVGTKMPRYCLFGDTINTASRMQSTSMPGKIQISAETNMMLEMSGGFITEERGSVEVKGKGLLQTYWLESINYKK